MSSRVTRKADKKPAQTIPARSLTPQHSPVFLQHADETATFEERSRHDALAGPGLGHDFGQIRVHPGEQAKSCPLAISPTLCPFGGACHTCPTPVQAKLNIGQPDDRYEQEADRVAEQVMRMPEPGIQSAPT